MRRTSIQTDTHPRRKKSLAQFRYLYSIHTIPFPLPQYQNPSKFTSPLCTKVWLGHGVDASRLRDHAT